MSRLPYVLFSGILFDRRLSPHLLVCHQRNAIFGRGAAIFVLTHFPSAKRNAAQARRKTQNEVSDLMVRSASSRVSNHEATRKAVGNQANRKTLQVDNVAVDCCTV